MNQVLFIGVNSKTKLLFDGFSGMAKSRVFFTLAGFSVRNYNHSVLSERLVLNTLDINPLTESRCCRKALAAKSQQKIKRENKSHLRVILQEALFVFFHVLMLGLPRCGHSEWP